MVSKLKLHTVEEKGKKAPRVGGASLVTGFTYLVDGRGKKKKLENTRTQNIRCNFFDDSHAVLPAGHLSSQSHRSSQPQVISEPPRWFKHLVTLHSRGGDPLGHQSPVLPKNYVLFLGDEILFDLLVTTALYEYHLTDTS